MSLTDIASSLTIALTVLQIVQTVRQFYKN